MQTHNLKRVHTWKKPAAVGRGGKRGKTSGKGTKGQNARAGRKKRPELRDMIKKLPKLRGYAFKSIQNKNVVFNLDVLESAFSAGEEVTLASLHEKGLLTAGKAKNSSVKILGTGDITKKLVISGCEVSASAKEKVLKAGGEVK